MNQLFPDACSRRITYLRMSVTEECNFHCLYCRPEEQPKKNFNLLSVDDYIRIADGLVRYGIQKIRITGGEPLLRDDLSMLIEQLTTLQEINNLSLTTNGDLLSRNISSLAQAGLHRINVSIDSLIPERFQRITGGGNLFRVLDGIHQAEQVLTGPIKINVVVFKNFNDDEILDFAKLSIENPWHIRFIEAMPMHTKYSLLPGNFYSAADIKNQIDKQYELFPFAEKSMHDGPAELYKIPGAKGCIGFIGAMTKPFCSSCNRLRLTADGKLRGCLFSNQEVDLLSIVQNGEWEKCSEELIRKAIESKPNQHHQILQHDKQQHRSMAEIGG